MVEEVKCIVEKPSSSKSSTSITNRAVSQQALVVKGTVKGEFSFS